MKKIIECKDIVPQTPDWYAEHIKSKEVALPIKIHPLLMCGCDKAIAEYDRLYEILIKPYCKIFERDGKDGADMFVRKVVSMYIDLWIDVREYNDIETRSTCANDTSRLKNFKATLSRAKRIEIEWESDGTHFSISEIKVIDSTKNTDSLRVEGGLNEKLLYDIVLGLSHQVTKLTPSHRMWNEYRKVISENIDKRLYFETDTRTANKEIAIKCRDLYRILLDYFEKQNGIHLPSDDAVNMTIRILGLNIDANYVDRFKRLIQGEK